MAGLGAVAAGWGGFRHWGGWALLLVLGAARSTARAEDISPPRVEAGGSVAASVASEDDGASAGDGRSGESSASTRSSSLETGEREYFAHPYGLVEFGVGVMALPDAKLCGGGAGCDRGDVSLEVDAWPLFRASPNFAVGAGMTLALIPMQDVPRVDSMFPREHARRYFTAEGIGRYYFAYGPALEVWSGISAGLIVVSDNFRTRTDDSAVIIGANSANIATEGLSLGLASGVTFGVNRHLQVGATLRFANWYLPPNPEIIAFGESASLSNRVTMLNLALTVAYHSH
ncbi:MAG TPA: hypothetical protein VMG12_02445 [Polyangiaceae bacterium]|nr:hypothetical protein [Polyangiaceae bacterium]